MWTRRKKYVCPVVEGIGKLKLVIPQTRKKPPFNVKGGSGMNLIFLPSSVYLQDLSRLSCMYALRASQ